MHHFERETQREQLIEVIVDELAGEECERGGQPIARRAEDMRYGGVQQEEVGCGALLKGAIYEDEVRFDAGEEPIQRGRVAHVAPCPLVGAPPVTFRWLAVHCSLYRGASKRTRSARGAFALGDSAGVPRA